MFIFSKITFDIGKVERWFLHYRVSLVKARGNIYSVTLKGQLQSLTSGQGHLMTQVDANRSYCTSIDASWCGTMSPFSCLYLFSIKRYMQKCDLEWPQMTFSWVTAQKLYIGHHEWPNKILIEPTEPKNGQRRHDPDTTPNWCTSLNGKNFNIYPLIYNVEVIEVTWPQVTNVKYMRYISFRYPCTYKTLKFWNCSEERFGFRTISKFNNGRREVGPLDLF